MRDKSIIVKYMFLPCNWFLRQYLATRNFIHARDIYMLHRSGAIFVCLIMIMPNTDDKCEYNLFVRTQIYTYIHNIYIHAIIIQRYEDERLSKTYRCAWYCYVISFDTWFYWINPQVWFDTPVLWHSLNRGTSYGFQGWLLFGGIWSTWLERRGMKSHWQCQSQ